MIPPSIAAWFAANLSRLLLFAGIIIVGLGLIQLRQCQKDRAEATRQRLDTGLATAARDSATDTINTVAARADADAATRQIEKDNADAIRTAPGADAPVDPVLADTARRGLCRYAAYRGRPECLQQPDTRSVASPR